MEPTYFDHLTKATGGVKTIAKALLKAHKSKCTHSYNEPQCLLDIGESCYFHTIKEQCQWWQACDCDACKIAKKLLGEGK